MITTLANLEQTSILFSCGAETDGETLLLEASDFTTEELTLIENFANHQQYSSVIYLDYEECVDVTININLPITLRNIGKEYAEETNENKTLIDSFVTLLKSKIN